MKAVAMLANGTSPADVARELGIPYQTVYNWATQARKVAERSGEPWPSAARKVKPKPQLAVVAEARRTRGREEMPAPPPASAVIPPPQVLPPVVTDASPLAELRKELTATDPSIGSKPDASTIREELASPISRPLVRPALSPPAPPVPMSAREELAWLRKELAHVVEEREILRQALLVVARANDPRSLPRGK